MTNSNDRSRSSSSRTKSASGSPHASTPAGGVGSPSAHEPTNLYVGGLHDSVRDQELEHRFSVFGRIESAKVMLHIHTGRSRGIGFVKFADHESAVAAIRGLHRTLLAGQRIMVRFADTRAEYRPGDKTDKVFVRNLPFDITHNQLRSHFERFGTVLDLTMHLDTAGFKAGGMGARTRMAYVRMSTVDEAEAAATQVHGTKPFPSCTALVMAKLAESENKRLERRAHKGSPSTEPPSNPSDTASSMHAAPDAQSNATPISEPSRVESHQSGRVAAVPPSLSSGVQTSSNPQTSSGSGSDKEKRESSESDDVNSNDNASGSGGTAAAPVRAVGKNHSHQQLGASATDATPLTPVVPTIPAVRVGGAVRPPTTVAGTASSANLSGAATSTKPSSAPPAPLPLTNGMPSAGAPLPGMLPPGGVTASGSYLPYPQHLGATANATGALGAFSPAAFAAAAGGMPYMGGYPTSAMFSYPTAAFPTLAPTPYGSAGFPAPYPSSSLYPGFPTGFAGLPTGYGGSGIPLSAASLASAAAAAPGLPYRFPGGVGPTGVSPPPGSLPLASPAAPPAGFAPWLAGASGVPGLLPS